MSSDLINNLSSREHYFRNAVEGEFTANVLQAARFEIERQSELLEECREALPVFERVIRLADTLASDVPVTAAARHHIDNAYVTLARLSSQTPADEGE